MELFMVLAFLLCIYFAPTYTALRRRKRNAGAIFFLNLTAGWTIVGWIFAMVWALTVDSDL